MLPFLNQLNLIRYLIVWRVNSSVVFFPQYFSLDISRVIGTIIYNRLPTKDKKSWKKTLEKLNVPDKMNSTREGESSVSIPESSWPINAVLVPYSTKRTYARGELIFWELKLFGKHADHGLFLEVILPALEEASFTSDPQFSKKNRLWGHFDIQHIYVARGDCWVPLVVNGKLDLHYRVNPKQWLEGLSFRPQFKQRLRIINWFTTFDLENDFTYLRQLKLIDDTKIEKMSDSPNLTLILANLIQRIDELLFKNSKTNSSIIELMDDKETKNLQKSFSLANNISTIKTNIRSVTPIFPGKWTGIMRYKNLPNFVVPYLEAASIIHIGKQTHYGCGTFALH